MLNTFGRTWTPRGVLAFGGLIAAIAAVFMAPAGVGQRGQRSVQGADGQFVQRPVGGVGKVEIAGMKAAANIINRQGGILGSKVEITTKDDAGDGAKATAAALQEIAAPTTTSSSAVVCSPRDFRARWRSTRRRR